MRKNRKGAQRPPDDAAEPLPLQFNADHLKRLVAQILRQMIKRKKSNAPLRFLP
jgi:hypothetical protein